MIIRRSDIEAHLEDKPAGPLLKNIREALRRPEVLKSIGKDFDLTPEEVSEKLIKCRKIIRRIVRSRD